MFMYITLVGIQIPSDILQSQEKHTESCIFLHLQNVKTHNVSKELAGVLKQRNLTIHSFKGFFFPHLFSDLARSLAFNKKRTKKHYDHACQWEL